MLTARDVTSADFETVAPDDVAGVPSQLGEAAFGGDPVVEDELLVGISTQQDVLQALGDERF